MSKPLLSQTKSSWLSMLWLVKKANVAWVQWTTEVTGPFDQDHGDTCGGAARPSDYWKPIKFTGTAENHWYRNLPPRLCVWVGSREWGWCWRWSRRLLKKTMRNALELRWKDAGKYLRFQWLHWSVRPVQNIANNLLKMRLVWPTTQREEPKVDERNCCNKRDRIIHADPSHLKSRRFINQAVVVGLLPVQKQLCRAIKSIKDFNQANRWQGCPLGRYEQDDETNGSWSK